MEENFSSRRGVLNGKFVSGLAALIVASILNLTFALLFILYATLSDQMIQNDKVVIFIVIGSLKIISTIMMITWLVIYFKLDSRKVKTILFVIACLFLAITIAWISLLIFIGGAMLMNLGYSV